ncbi:MAG: 4Fe-4S binding protein, partial [Oscillospiraceae bacterium]|nr:4Fe-4S binding protein [Oscillospiraceae bacterium]
MTEKGGTDMALTSQMIKEKAKELGIDCIAIGNIERFNDAPKLMSPITYFPNAKSVIAIAMRIPRGTYRGIEEGTHWHNYTFYSYNKLNSLFRPKKSYELACFIEDHGYEAVPHYPAVPEGNGVTREPVKEGGVPADVVASVRLIAAGTGLGEIGYSKVFLTKKFGPRVRLGLIFTDAVLEPDPIMDTGTLCIHCGACVRECPGNAVPSLKEENKRIEVDYGEKKVWYGDVQMGRCTLSHHGFNNECSPFHKKEFPNMAFDVRNTDMTEEEAYILCYSLANAKWGRKPGSGQVMEYYDYILKHTGYFAICGARGCIRACMNALEKAGRIENTFKEPFYKKKSWLLSNKPEKVSEGVNPFREEYLDEKYPGIRENEYKK